MSEVIAVASGKGGVGKTTVVAGLSACLAAMGYKVLAVDADIGLRNLDIALGMSDMTALDFGDVLAGRTSFEKAAVSHYEFKNLFLLNAPNVMPDAEDTEFAEMIRHAKSGFDYCFIDCSAGLGRSLRMAAASADRAVIVTTPDIASLRDAAQTAELFEQYGVSKIGLIVNRVRPRLIEKGEAPNIDDAMDASGVPLLGIIPEDERVISGTNHGKPIVMTATGGAALAFYNISRRITGKKIPLMKIK